MDCTMILRNILEIRNKNSLSSCIKENHPLKLSVKDYQIGEFLKRATEIKCNITSLKYILKSSLEDLLATGDYMNPNNPSEVNEFEEKAENLIFMSKNALDSLKNEVNLSHSSWNCEEFTEMTTTIINILNNYLQSVTQCYTDIKTERMNFISGKNFITKILYTPEKIKNLKKTATLHQHDKSMNLVEHTMTSDNSTFIDDDTSLKYKENIALYDRLTNTVQETKLIQKQVNQISELQQIFSEKIIEQASQIERIHEHAITSYDYVTEGNKYLKKANYNLSSYQRWVIMMLISFTITLLALHFISK